MRIIFTNEAGDRLGSALAAGHTHWDACLIGHKLLADGAFVGADDFIVEEISRSPLAGNCNDNVNVCHRECIAMTG
jgi:hypothetical protein